jgi:hypothetical protein
MGFVAQAIQTLASFTVFFFQLKNLSIFIRKILFYIDKTCHISSIKKNICPIRIALATRNIIETAKFELSIFPFLRIYNALVHSIDYQTKNF